MGKLYRDGRAFYGRGEKYITNANIEVTQKSENIENIIRQEKLISEAFKSEVHNIAAASVKDITKEIIQVYPYLGIDASREDHPLNLIFRDYFTATQHYNFTRAENSIIHKHHWQIRASL